MTPPHHKGKGVDRSTSWTPYEWDSRGFYVSSRCNSSGAVEYRYKYNSPGEQTTTEQQNIIPKSQYWDIGQAESSAPAAGALLPASPSADTSYMLAGQNSGNINPTPNTYFPASSTAGGQSFNVQGTVNVPGVATYPGSNIQGVPPASFARSFNAPGPANMTGVNFPTAWSNVNPAGLANPSYFPQSSSALDAPSLGANPTWAQTPSLGTGYGQPNQTPYVPNVDISELTRRFKGMDVIPEDGPLDIATSLYLSQIKNIRRQPGSDYVEELDPRFQAVAMKDWKTFWIVGRVFMMLWTEASRGVGAPTKSTAPINTSQYSTVWLNETVYTEIRRFVVIRVGYGYTLCSPIHSYGGQGTLKPNLSEVQQHCIIYTGKECPPPLAELDADGNNIRQEQLTKDPIKVKREQLAPEGDLGNCSRLNYSKISTVEMYVRVLNIGVVDRNSQPSLGRNSYLRSASSLEPPQKGSRAHKNLPSGSGSSKKPGESSSSAKKESKREDKRDDKKDDKKSHGSHKDDDKKSHGSHKDKKGGHKGH